MLSVGLTGGLATGKSHVGKILQSLGCYLLKADELGHKALMPDGAAYQAVVSAFGRGIVDESGFIIRRKLGAEVFGDSARLAVLNSIIHPVVIAQEDAWLRALAQTEPEGVAVVEAAILIETGNYQRFSKLVVTTCSREQQIERAMKRDGLSREEVELRLQRQMPLEEKVKLADYVIDTSSEVQETVRQVHETYQLLLRDVSRESR